MGADLKLLFAVRELTSAQREAILMEAHAYATESNDTVLQAHIARALAHERQVRDLDRTYQATKASRGQYAEELQELDPMADRQLTAIYTRLEISSEAAHSDPTVPTKAAALLDKVFPLGVRPITAQPYPEQNRLLKDIVAELQGPSAPLVADLALTGMVEPLARISQQYDEAIQRSPGGVAHGTLVRARGRGHELVLEAVARVIGMNFDSEVPAQVEARGRVLSVLFREIAAASERRRTRAAANRRRREREEGAGGDDVDQVDGKGD
jgi:hypothetical protein